MLERISLLVWLCLFSLAALPQRRQEPEQPIRPVEGAKLFHTHCASCHGDNGKGDGPVSQALRRPIPDLTSLSQRNKGVFPAEQVRSVLAFGIAKPLKAHGSKSMPIWGPIFHEIEFDLDLGNVRVENLTKYLQSIQVK